jgi:hypothetical protein
MFMDGVHLVLQNVSFYSALKFIVLSVKTQQVIFVVFGETDFLI